MSRYADLPGYTDLTKARAAVASRLDSLVGQPLAPIAEPSLVADQLVAGESLERLSESFADAARAADLRDREARWLSDVHTHLTDRVKTFETNSRNVEAAIKSMRADLADILTQAAAAHAALGSIDTAADATRTPETAAAWSSLRGLAQRYRHLATEHQQLISQGRVDGDPIGLMAVRNWRESGVLFVRNAADLEPERSIREDNLWSVDPSWPDAETKPEAFVRWLGGPEADGWLPTAAEAHEATQQLLAGRSEAEAARNKRTPRTAANLTPTATTGAR